MKRQMKKQEGPTTSSSEKKRKTEPEKMPPEEEEEEMTRPPPPEIVVAAAAAAVAAEEEMEVMWGLGLKDGGDVDEQMSWGMGWLPLWDVEFVEGNYEILFNDFVWDDDLWNLRTVTDVPRRHDINLVSNDPLTDRV